MKMENERSIKSQTKGTRKTEEKPSTAAGRNQFSWLTERAKRSAFLVFRFSPNQTNDK